MVDEAPDELPPAPDAVDAVLAAGAGHDLVGLWQSGAIHRGFASSLGHRLLKTSHSFHLDFTLYAQRDKAAKGRYAGTRFDEAALRDQLAFGRPPGRDPAPARAAHRPGRLPGLPDAGRAARDRRPVCVGRVRRQGPPGQADPAAAHARRRGATLAPGVTLADDAAAGVAPPFLSGGFARPARVDLDHRAAA